MIRMENSRPYGPLSEQRLQAYEERLGARLPPEYRRFLMQYNGASPEPSEFWIKKGSDSSKVQRLYGLHDGPVGSSIDDWLDAEESSMPTGVPRNMVAIGDDGVGNQICIGIAGEERGAIYFIDHELHHPGMTDSLKGIAKLADSLDHFLTMLQDIPE